MVSQTKWQPSEPTRLTAASPEARAVRGKYIVRYGALNAGRPSGCPKSQPNMVDVAIPMRNTKTPNALLFTAVCILQNVVTRMTR